MGTQQEKQNFLKLILDNKGVIIRICNSYCANKNDREDLAQEITIQLWRAGDHYDPNQKFSTWMYRVALNVAISWYRKGKSAILPVLLNEAHYEMEDVSGAEDEATENINLLQRFINELPELDKALMILFLEGKTHAETGDILGISETNVATRISRIKKKIKQRFSALNK